MPRSAPRCSAGASGGLLPGVRSGTVWRRAGTVPRMSGGFL
nr:MAG TPA: hypothetical protein [Caudoviricetes sp.]